MAQISSASQSSFLQLGIFSSSQGCTKHVLCGATKPWPYPCQHPSCAHCHPESLQHFTQLWVFLPSFATPLIFSLSALTSSAPGPLCHPWSGLSWSHFSWHEGSLTDCVWKEKKGLSDWQGPHLISFPRISHAVLISLVLQLHITRRSQEKKICVFEEMDSN